MKAYGITHISPVTISIRLLRQTLFDLVQALTGSIEEFTHLVVCCKSVQEICCLLVVPNLRDNDYGCPFPQIA